MGLLTEEQKRLMGIESPSFGGLPVLFQESCGFALTTPRLTARRDLIEAARIHARIRGWGGERKIPKKELVAFAEALKKQKFVDGFSFFSQTVQLKKADLARLEAFAKSQGRFVSEVFPAKTNITYFESANVPKKGQVVGFKDDQFKIVRAYPTKADADGPLPRELLRLVKKDGGAAVVELLPGKSDRQPGQYVVFFKASGEMDGAPVWLQPAQYKRALSYQEKCGKLPPVGPPKSFNISPSGIETRRQGGGWTESVTEARKRKAAKKRGKKSEGRRSLSLFRGTEEMVNALGRAHTLVQRVNATIHRDRTSSSSGMMNEKARADMYRLDQEMATALDAINASSEALSSIDRAHSAAKREARQRRRQGRTESIVRHLREEEFSPEELATLSVMDMMKPAARKKELDYVGLPYGPDAPAIKSLIQKGIVQIRGNAIVYDRKRARAVMKSRPVPPQYKSGLTNYSMQFKRESIGGDAPWII